MIRFAIVFLYLVLIPFTGCVISRPIEQSFVPKREILAAEIMESGVKFYGANRYEEAELAFRQVLYLYPDSEKAKFNLSLSQGKLGFIDEAVKSLNELSIKYPKMWNYRFAIAEILAEAKRYDESIAILETIRLLAEEENRKEQFSIASRNLSTINFLLGNQEKAICYSYDAYQSSRSKDEAVRHLKILFGAGLYNAAGLVLADFEDRQVDPFFVYFRLLNAFVLDNKDEVLKQGALALELKYNDPELAYELNLLQALVRDRYGGESDVDTLKTLTEDSRMYGAGRIYWPPVMMLEAFKLKNKVDNLSNDGIFDNLGEWFSSWESFFK